MASFLLQCCTMFICLLHLKKEARFECTLLLRRALFSQKKRVLSNKRANVLKIKRPIQVGILGLKKNL